MLRLNRTVNPSRFRPPSSLDPLPILASRCNFSLPTLESCWLAFVGTKMKVKLLRKINSFSSRRQFPGNVSWETEDELQRLRRTQRGRGSSERETKGDIVRMRLNYENYRLSSKATLHFFFGHTGRNTLSVPSSTGAFSSQTPRSR